MIVLKLEQQRENNKEKKCDIIITVSFNLTTNYTDVIIFVMIVKHNICCCENIKMSVHRGYLRWLLTLNRDFLERKFFLRLFAFPCVFVCVSNKRRNSLWNRKSYRKCFYSYRKTILILFFHFNGIHSHTNTHTVFFRSPWFSCLMICRISA